MPDAARERRHAGERVGARQRGQVGERGRERAQRAHGLARAARAARGRASPARPARGRGARGSASGSSRPSGLGSSSTLRISLPETPSTTEWWIFVSSADAAVGAAPGSGTAPTAGGGGPAGGRRCAPRSRPAAGRRPGGGTADSRMWKSRSKSGSSIQYGWSSPSGTSTSRQRNGGSRCSRSPTRRQMSLIVERPARRGRGVVDGEAADVPVGGGGLDGQELGVEAGQLPHPGRASLRCACRPWLATSRVGKIRAQRERTGGRPQMSDATKRLVLVACILGTTVVTVDSTAVNVALPGHRRGPGRRPGGPAVDGQRVPAHARLAAARRRLARATSSASGACSWSASAASARPRCCARWPRRSSCSSPGARCRAWPARCSPRRRWP